MGGASEGAAHVQNAVAGIQGFKQGRGLAKNKIDNGDQSLFLIRVGNGQGNALAVFAHAQHDKMAGLSVTGNFGCFEHHLARFAGNQGLFFDNWYRHIASRKEKEGMRC